MVTPIPSKDTPVHIPEKDFINFVIKNQLKYIRKFKKFNIDEVDNFKITWNWPAFLFSFWWFLYRKLYHFAFIAIIAGIIFLYLGSRLFFLIIFSITQNRVGSSEWGVYCALLLLFLIKIIWGITGNYIYYKYSKKKIIDFKNKQPSLSSSEVSRSLGKIGGVNKWVPSCAVILIIISFIAAIYLPNFSGTKISARNSEAQACLKAAVTAQEAYYVDNKTYTDSIENLLGDIYGLNIDQDILLKIISAGEDHYHMIAFHKNGDRKYQIKGPGGTIRIYSE